MTTLDAMPGVLAAAVVEAALELVGAQENGPPSRLRADDALLASARVKAAIAEVPGAPDAEGWKQVITRLAVFLARGVVKRWSNAYPDRLEPLRAVEAAEAWAACPCAHHAEAAAETAPGAARQAMAAWRSSPKEAAWAGRTAAWAADAPKYGWQTIAAIVGACRATGSKEVIAMAERFFSAELRSR
ncbi:MULTISPECIES: hypothetical protein [Sorangium]|uniref:Uncharacterized protein n=1 Tax=Sorangium cellulosum TaxID=56 RepID=A0A4P2QEV5_SORCE|nr:MULTISPECIES: hypothetical protein [Sorangium]AUX28374.1 uncharacterized protein SOCE836_004440 [Sorangium cellulosum]WCQ87766.1 hypothetical protein NQZ70_00429 [Sorangium sp. Soce836]